jgi:hypothetical protein
MLDRFLQPCKRARVLSFARRRHAFVHHRPALPEPQTLRVTQLDAAAAQFARRADIPDLDERPRPDRQRLRQHERLRERVGGVGEIVDADQRQHAQPFLRHAFEQRFRARPERGAFLARIALERPMARRGHHQQGDFAIGAR